MPGPASTITGTRSTVRSVEGVGKLWTDPRDNKVSISRGIMSSFTLKSKLTSYICIRGDAKLGATSAKCVLRLSHNGIICCVSCVIQ